MPNPNRTRFDYFQRRVWECLYSKCIVCALAATRHDLKVLYRGGFKHDPVGAADFYWCGGDCECLYAGGKDHA